MNKIVDIFNQLKSINIVNILDMVVSLIIILTFWYISRLIAFATVKIIKGKTIERAKVKDHGLYNPIKWFIRASGFYFGAVVLQMPTQLHDMSLTAYKIACIIILAKGIVNVFHPKATIFKKLEEKTSYSGDKALNTFISKIIKFVAYIVAGYMVLMELGYDLGGLATGLGISGAVLALAAQDLAKNLFAGISIVLDKPFLVGNTIETADCFGTVIDITFKSTRIRSIDNTIITIPNSKINLELVKNWSKIKKRYYDTTLHLPLETSKEKVEKLIKKISFVLKADETVVQESLLVHFESIDKQALQIIVKFYTTKVKYNEYEAFKDKINLELLQILDSENIKLAYPSNNIYLKSDEREEERLESEEA